MKRRTGWVAWGVAVCAGLMGGAAVASVGDMAESGYRMIRSGEEVALHAALDAGSVAPVWYRWRFGDGAESAVETVSGAVRYELSARHAYQGPAGQPFNAELIVADNPAFAMYQHRPAQDGLLLIGDGAVRPLSAVPVKRTRFLADPVVAPIRVICVPWQGDIRRFHTTWTGHEVLLKAVVRATNQSQRAWYRWDFGDGTQSAIEPLSGATKYAVEVRHAYAGAKGTPFVARLSVADNVGLANPVIDTYLVRIEVEGLDSRINVAIDNGLWFLYKRGIDARDSFRTFDGSPCTVWELGTYFACASASAVHAFQINGHKETGNPAEDPYVEAVWRGLNWIFNGYVNDANHGILMPRPIAASGGNDPDTNGNGIGIEVRDWVNNPVYQGGQVMDAIIASGTPDADTGRDFDGDGNNETYREVVQEMCDAYAWGQADSGTAQGGWRYNWNSDSDNSICQWAAIGMIPAQGAPWNCVVPAWVKTLNLGWLDRSFRNNLDGHAGWGVFGYSGLGHAWGWNAVTPSGLVQLIMDGQGTDNAKWQACERWIAENWASGQNWLNQNNNGNQMYAYYAFAKAMRLANNGANPVVNFASTGFDWYRGDGDTIGLAAKIADRLVATSVYPGAGTFGDVMPTGWAVITLRPVLFAAAPTACFDVHPNPSYADQPIFFDPRCSAHSEPGKDIRNLVRFEWDWDADGTFDTVTNRPVVVEHRFACPVLPCTYPVTLRVWDDSEPPRSATFSVDVRITNPPHPPVGRVAGPSWVSLCAGDTLTLDASASYDPDEGDREAGCAACPTDTITAWNWDLDGAPWTYTGGAGAMLDLGAGVAARFPAPGEYHVGVRVSDNTLRAYPMSGLSNLTDQAFNVVRVFADGGLCDLRVVETNCERLVLAWPAIGADRYEIYASREGVNRGYALAVRGHTNVMEVGAVPMGVTTWWRVMATRGTEQFLSKAVAVTPPSNVCVLAADPGGPYRGVIGVPVPLDGAGSRTASGSIAAWDWDLDGDRDFDDATGVSVDWTWNVAGVYPVCLRITTADRRVHTQCTSVEIVGFPRPKADFAAAPRRGVMPLEVTFTDRSVGTITNRVWDFGASGGATVANPAAPVRHTYATGGVYSVSLSVTGPGGADMLVLTNFIRVSSTNRAPIACGAANQIFLRSLGEMALLDARCSSDPDDDRLFFSWRESPANPVRGLIPIGADAMSQIGLYFPMPGRYDYEVQVSDGIEASAGVWSFTVYAPGLKGVVNVAPRDTVRIPDARLSVYASRVEAEADLNPVDAMLTDSRGEYTFEHLTPQDTQFARDYYLKIQRGGFNASEIQTVTIRPDPNFDENGEDYLLGRGTIPSLGGIVRQTNGLPIEGCTVTVCPAVGGDVFSDTTGLDGRFRIFFVPIGMWVVQFLADGYQAQVREMNIDARTTDLQITLPPSTRASVLRGRVTLAGTDLPLVNARVELGDTGEQFTDAGGFFRYETLAEGSYPLQVGKDGYEVHRQATVVVRPGDNVMDVALAPKGVVVLGQVVDWADGRPVRGARVGIEIKARELYRSAQTDCTGFFAIEDAPSGSNMNLRVSALHYDTRTIPIARLDRDLPSLIIRLRHTQDWVAPRKPAFEDPIAAVAQPFIFITNMHERVVLDGRPSTGRDLTYVWRESPSNPQRVLHAAAGNMKAPTNVVAGIRLPGVYIFELQVQSGAKLSQNKAAVAVYAPGLAGNVHVSPSDGLYALHGVRLRVYREFTQANEFGPGFVDEVFSKAEGQDWWMGDFAFERLTTGSYWFAAQVVSNVTATNFSLYGPVRRFVNYSTAARKSRVNMARNEFRYEGVVRAAEAPGRALENARVVVQPGTLSEFFRTTTDATGVFRLPLIPEGSQWVAVYCDGFEANVTPQSFFGNVTNEVLRLRRSTTPPSAVIRGWVTTTYSVSNQNVECSVPNAEVILAGVGRAFSDVRGYFEIRNLPAGKYYGLIRRPGYRPAPLADSGQLFQLRAGETLTFARRSLRFDGPGPTVDLVLVGAQNQPVPRARVTIMGRPAVAVKAGATSSVAAEPTAWVESDASGAAQLAGVPYGARDFIIQVPGMPPARVRLSVEGSMRVPVSLTGESAPRDFGQWRTNNFTAAELADPSISGADADPDRDGLRNLQEFAADTSPLNAGPRPAGFAPRLERGGPGQLRFRIDESSDARVYDLYWRTNLLTGTWQKLGPRVMGTGTNLEITVAVSNGFKRCFYRPVVSLP